MRFASRYRDVNVFTSDGVKVGRVTNVYRHTGTGNDYLVVADKLIPINKDFGRVSGDSLILPYTKDFVDNAPSANVADLRDADSLLVDDYYRRKAA
jgi:hypothetical protein